MKYALMVIRSNEGPDRASNTESEFRELVRWRSELWALGKITTEAVLAPPGTAKTLSWHDNDPIVSDGPYVEAKESVGGFLVLEVESEAEALEIARSWPACHSFRLELRPVVTELT